MLKEFHFIRLMVAGRKRNVTANDGGNIVASLNRFSEIFSLCLRTKDPILHNEWKIWHFWKIFDRGAVGRPGLGLFASGRSNAAIAVVVFVILR